MEKDKENHIDMNEVEIYLDGLYKKRMRLCMTHDCLIESLSVTTSWKYAREKIVLIVEDYMLPFFWEKMAKQMLQNINDNGLKKSI